ncbi:MAG: hypothetical protein KC425_22970 [Anaerolineales bacterium]|nr:hypothetical protein [Anaerolineales bacterium]
MRLEKKADAELARRQGQARRTVIQLIWLLISFVVAYFVATRVIFAPAEGLLTYQQVYRWLQISSNDLPQWVILGAVMLLIVIVMQFVFFIGYFAASPEGRRRTGTPSLHSRSKDPLDNTYDR